LLTADDGFVAPLVLPPVGGSFPKLIKPLDLPFLGLGQNERSIADADMPPGCPHMMR
jgi:hypothetical protein